MSQATPNYYPPSPRGVPEELAEPSIWYRQQVSAMAAALIAFFLIYIGLILLVLILLFAIYLPRRAPSGALWLTRITLGPILFLVLAYLIRNLFKVVRREKEYDVRLDPREHPRLFQFLENVCRETGAPLPEVVVVNYEVNAYAYRDSGFLSLFFKPQLKLGLGMGLVNTLNLSEFKAVLAHELGHMSQGSMKFGGFVMLARKIVHNILFGETGFDRFMKSTPVLNGIHWTFSKGMEGVFFLVLKLDAAMSREMEFHADQIAVSVAGSDAIVSTLYKSLYGSWCMQQLAGDLEVARDHRLFSTDIFLHQRETARFLRKKLRDPLLGSIPALPADPCQTLQIFDPDDDEQADMWASHPPNHEREQNAKEFYIRTEYDERSPWLLFNNAAALREKLSRQFYRAAFNTPWNTPLANAKEVQRFLDEEYGAYALDPKYGGLYDARLLNMDHFAGTREAAEKHPNPPAELIAAQQNIYSNAVREFARMHHRHLDEYEFLLGIVRKQIKLKKKRFEFRGQRHSRKEAKRLLEMVEKTIDQDQAWLKHFDDKVFAIHYGLALRLSKAWAKELIERYQFHYVVQRMWKLMRDQQWDVMFLYEFLPQIQGGSLSWELFEFCIQVFRDAHHAMQSVLELARGSVFPPFSNFPAGQPLHTHLLNAALLPKPSHWDTQISHRWIVEFVFQFKEVQRKLFRLHYKSLSALLALQETIGAAATAPKPGAAQ